MQILCKITNWNRNWKTITEITLLPRDPVGGWCKTTTYLESFTTFGPDALNDMSEPQARPSNYKVAVGCIAKTVGLQVLQSSSTYDSAVPWWMWNINERSLYWMRLQTDNQWSCCCCGEDERAWARCGGVVVGLAAASCTLSSRPIELMTYNRLL